ncbi:DNRLRE domain-containing protein [Paenibacillus sp. J2TS4]|uniref:CBM96 family carbohydrate-binding protein n=1 Tax=Paenibacillus sp. J2TS4 TaxID=2807194 RepID=UPI001BCC02F5|nr:DNRLRE domain-containing protein [Paenibacillus sp. J2TS4]
MILLWQRRMAWRADGRLGLLVLLCIGIMLGTALLPSHASAEAAVSIDSHQDGEQIPAGRVTLFGTYHDAYDVQVLVNGSLVADVLMDDPDGDDSGSWSYVLDTTSMDGEFSIAVKASDAASRYGVWSDFMTLKVDNASANIPQVKIVSPEDGGVVSGKVPIKIAAEGRNPIKSVEIRINGGEWRRAAGHETEYKYLWDASGLGDRMLSIEARAKDSLGNTGRSMTTYVQSGNGGREEVTVTNQDRAIWIWEPAAYNLLLNPGSRLVLDSMAKDTETFGSDPVTTLYLAVDGYGGIDILEDDPAKVREFMRWAHENGYQVHACIAGGTAPPYMGALEGYHDRAVRLMEKIINYQLTSEASERFDGVNVDIEPYIMPLFKSDYPSVQVQYLDVLAKMIERRDTAGVNLSFGPAIPRWYDSSEHARDITWNGSTKWLSEHIQDISDYIAIMNYRDTADGSVGIIEQAASEIAYAESIGKPNSVVIAVETLDIANGGDPETITFREEGRDYMERELAKVYAAYADSPPFAGMAMHHYDSVRGLPSDWSRERVYWEPPADDEAPTALSGPPTASVFNYERIDLRYGMAYDNLEVGHYNIYRSTESGFVAGPANLAGTSRSLRYTDEGLLPDTTYYYKVAAVDLQGNVGPSSPEIEATTGSTSLRPMVVAGMSVEHTGTNVRVSLRMADYETGEGLAASVHGRFTYAGGRYVDFSTGPSGEGSALSESIPVGQQTGFEPRRVMAPGYYWAKAYDQPHTAELYSTNAYLDGLFIGEETLEPIFHPDLKAYSVSVTENVYEVTVTPLTMDERAQVTVNGEPVQSGGASQVISVPEGKSEITVRVTAEDGTARVYSIEMKRQAPVGNLVPITEDAYVRSGPQSAKNFGQAKWIEVGEHPPSEKRKHERIGYMKAVLPEEAASFVTAMLHWYVDKVKTPSVPLSIYVFSGEEWNENTITWNSVPFAGNAISCGSVPVSSSGWYELDVTGCISALGPVSEISFLLVEETASGSWARINSKEHSHHSPYIHLG